MSRLSTRAIAGAVVLVLALAACGGGDGEGEGRGQTLTVWSLENLADRMEATRKITNEFTSKTGIKVNLVGVDENQFNQLITSAAAADELPDVVGALPLAAVRSLAVNELLDTDTTGKVVEDLGRDTFSERALELTADGDTQLSVPSDAWAQLLVYRKDLFGQAGLQPPTTYDAIKSAAAALNKGGTAGITAATAPDDAFTQQTFEHLALGNGCEMVDDSGNVTLDSSECVESFGFFNELIRNYSVRGTQSVDSTRATYFAGKAAMIVWSSFILDEMAGLRKDALPSCPQCREDPLFLAKNSGVVTAIQGPSGSEPRQFGEVVSWVITDGAKADAAQQFVGYMMNEGYESWLAIAPEGKFPTRRGNQDDPQAYAEAWDRMPAGVDTKKPLSEIYSADVLRQLKTGVDTFSRWGITQGQGKLVGATLGELPVPKAINAMTSGELTPEAAARRADKEVELIKESQ